jgi:hypothetical protein
MTAVIAAAVGTFFLGVTFFLGWRLHVLRRQVDRVVFMLLTDFGDDVALRGNIFSVLTGLYKKSSNNNNLQQHTTLYNNDDVDGGGG